MCIKNERLCRTPTKAKHAAMLVKGTSIFANMYKTKMSNTLVIHLRLVRRCMLVVPSIKNPSVHLAVHCQGIKSEDRCVVPFSNSSKNLTCSHPFTFTSPLWRPRRPNKLQIHLLLPFRLRRSVPSCGYYAENLRRFPLIAR